MSARLLAIVCLLYVSANSGWAASLPRTETKLVVHLQADAASSPQILDQMKSELDSIMEPTGIHIVWGPGREEGAPDSLRVELKGSCGVSSHADGSAAPGGAVLASALASSAVNKNGVLPVSWVNCETLNRLLLSSIALQPAYIRRHNYGRAMARVLAHEIYHVVAHTQLHTSTGLTKESLSANELISSRFAFSAGAIDDLRSQHAGLAWAARR